MDSDTKHVLTILGFVACFGAGYFVCNAENKDILKTGERFKIFSQIENAVSGNAKIISDSKGKAVENAVNSYYQTNDKYFDYKNDENLVLSEDTGKSYEYLNKYQIIDNIAYINCGDFYMDGTQGFIHFFMDNPETDGFVIDLRENKGGYTDYCMNMLEYFIEPQKVVKYYYNDGKTKDVEIINNNKCTDEKVIILVNENTASAAEIFTSAMMQFYDGEVTVVGTKTYGKGTFQEYKSLSDNERFRYTAGTYTVGSWQCYDGAGITPDIEVSMEYSPDIICTDEDVQLQKALDLFK